MYLSGSVILRQEVWRQKPGLRMAECLTFLTFDLGCRAPHGARGLKLIDCVNYPGLKAQTQEGKEIARSQLPGLKSLGLRN